MVEARSLENRYQTELRAGSRRIVADTHKDGLGGGAGMRPHELLEAALASCLAISARMALQELGMEEPRLGVRVELERGAQETVFVYALEPHRALNDAQRAAIYARLEHSPVRETLSRPLRFEQRASTARRA